MSKREKLIKKILNGKSDISPDEAIKLLESFGFTGTSPKGGSSHLTFRKQNAKSITIVLTQNPLKPYMIEKLKEILQYEEY
ncbi:MAG: type II toxin-antitoxin system HicA family toxin [Candidatus Gastranaerophilales bacterium]|nr:type II toxin-antitoxin system HicA family toxin [Candidatus Gastranaerophilales bacterium]